MPKTQKNSPKRTILIVEDSTDFATLMKFIIEDDGFEGIPYPLEHEDFIGWVKEHDPATILMDLALRRKNGMDYIEELKADPETSEIPIVAVTAHAMAEHRVKLLDAGCCSFISKPISYRPFLEEIARVLCDQLHTT